MKSMNKRLRFILGVVPVVVGIAIAQATPDEVPCAFMIKNGKAAQLIPPQGKVTVHFSENHPIACGAMLITHDEPFWIKLSNQTVVKIAPHSFLELPKSKSETYRIYRGELLVSAPPSISKQIWSTPNSESHFQGGVAWIQYSAQEKVTTAACFNRNFKFKNKFNPNAVQTIHAGEMSSLAIQNAQVMPSQPAVMDYRSIALAMEKLALPESDKSELTAIVKRVYEDRSKSLVSEIDEWQDQVEEGPSREIASVPSTQKSSIDPKEAEFITRMMRERLYGNSEDERALDSDRKPASIGSSKKNLADPEKDKQKKIFDLETRRVEKEIERLGADEE